MKQTKIELRIDWSELDLFGHVNNVAFFKYIQASRLYFCEQIGLTSLNEVGKLSFMVASSQCDFKKPLFYPGEVIVTTRQGGIKNTSFSLLHTLEDASASVVAEAVDVLVLYDYAANKKVEVSEELRSRMQ